MPQEGPNPAWTPAAEAYALLQAVACPVLQVGADGRVVWANTAAVRDLAVQNGQPAAALWLEEPQGPSQAVQACGSGKRYQLDVAPLPNGCQLWTLQSVQALHETQMHLAHEQELLGLARDFGRLGIWERDVRTLKGNWDREVLRFWGLDPNQGTPDFAAATANILPEDRAALGNVFTASLKQAGRYSARYRVRGNDGQVRRIHSQWLVKNGADGLPERVLGLMMDDSEPYALAQATQELESQLALAVEVSGVAIWRHDLATGLMHYSDQGWRALGLKPRPEGLTLDEARDLVHPDDLPTVMASAQAALQTNQAVEFEARYLHADGTWLNQMLRRTVLRDDQGRPTAFLGVAMDITERVQQRRQTSELIRRLETVTRVAGIGHWLQEPGQTRPVWSEQMHAMFGLPSGDAAPDVREWLSQKVHPEDRPALERALRAWSAASQGNLESSFRVVRAPGDVRQFISHSTSEQTDRGVLRFGVVIDITDRRQSERALRTAEDRISLAVRGLGLGTWQYDVESGLTQWDAPMWLLRGYEPQARAMTPEERLACVHPDDRDRIEQWIAEVGESDTFLENQFRVVWPDGQVRWLATRSRTTVDAEGQRRRIGVNWDITATITAEAAHRDREVALRDSQAKSQFMARMSHELRTPLNAVLGFTQLLLAEEKGEDPPALSRKRRLEHIRSAGQHLLTLINDVLDLSALTGGELRIAQEPVSVRAVYESSLPLLGPLLEERGISIEAESLEFTVTADSTRLRQVLLNLLSNAIKYNRPGGQVRVDARQDQDRVVIRVSDTGRGMDDAQQRHLFEPFNRLGVKQDSVEGTGIGLAIVKALVQRMGGEVQVRSQPGVGSEFEVSLAVGQALASPDVLTEPEPCAAAPKPPSDLHRQVLYIEDNPVNAMIIGELLARRGDLTLQVAVNGTEGVEQAHRLRPDLILLDMQLPDFDGYEVLRQLRQDPRTEAIPCIALSANAMPHDIERALSAGMSDYWTKPLDFKAFMASLEALFGKPA